MKRNFLIYTLLTALALISTAVIGQSEPDPPPPGTYPTECPPDQVMECGTYKYNIGPVYFACSTAMFQDAFGEWIVICCQYEAQNVGCEVDPPPDNYATDLRLVMSRMRKQCFSPPTGQSCGDPEIE